MKICHADEAADDSDNADELDFVVILDAAGEIVGDFLMKYDYENAGSE